MKLTLMLATSLLLISTCFAQQPPPPPHEACQGDPRCEVVDDNDPRLPDGNGSYDPRDDKIYLSKRGVAKGDCGKYLYDHENYHRKQNREGKLNDPWAEQDAQQNAPVYNCGGDGPSGAIGRYYK
jgi:hypothetical protein